MALRTDERTRKLIARDNEALRGRDLLPIDVSDPLPAAARDNDCLGLRRRMHELLIGRLQAGKNDASHWLSKFNEAYSRKAGMSIFPGSLNLALDHPFDWLLPATKSASSGLDAKSMAASVTSFSFPASS